MANLFIFFLFLKRDFHIIPDYFCITHYFLRFLFFFLNHSRGTCFIHFQISARNNSVYNFFPPFFFSSSGYCRLRNPVSAKKPKKKIFHFNLRVSPTRLFRTPRKKKKEKKKKITEEIMRGIIIA